MATTTVETVPTNEFIRMEPKPGDLVLVRAFVSSVNGRKVPRDHYLKVHEIFAGGTVRCFGAMDRSDEHWLDRDDYWLAVTADMVAC